MTGKPSALAACAALSVFSLFAGPVFADADPDPSLLNFRVDTAHTRIVWEIPTGSGIFMGFFTGAKGSLTFDQTNPEKSAIHIDLAADSVLTGVGQLDEKLKGDEYFDAAAFPQITFDSTSINITGEKTAIIDGNLTIRGITLPVALDTVFRNQIDLGSVERMSFGATTTISRKAYGITALEDWLSDEVKLRIELETGRRSQAPTKPQ